MKLFIDANVLVAVLNKEQPLYSLASRILSLPADKCQLYTSPLCLGIAYYFAEKKSGTKLANHKIRLLCDHLGIVSMDETVVKNTVSNLFIEDFEDGMQYYSAMSKNVNVIITEDVGDYHFSEIAVLRCNEFFEQFLFKV